MAKVFPKEDGSPTSKWRVADLYFADYDTAVAALSSPEGHPADSHNDDDAER